MIELIILVTALSLDAFAVSIGFGARHQSNALILAIKAGLYFGLFQGLMPILGYLGTRNIDLDRGLCSFRSFWIAHLNWLKDDI